MLLCDEPTGALDVATGITVLEAIDTINRELGTLTLIITHNAIIGDMADRVLTLSHGRISNERRNDSRAPVRRMDW
ncbi:Methionine import ATP-binding protein MetN [compost metagenome]